MSQSNRILWKKEHSRDSYLYIELFAGRGYERHINWKKVSFQDVKEFPDRPVRVSTHFLDSKNDEKAKEEREAGNELFGQQKYFEAIIKFNNALRLARNDSNELGLAYANRSSCFFHLKMFEECLIDIELAKKSNYPEQLKHKMEDRIVKVKQLMACKPIKINGVRPRESVLSFKEHVDFPGVAECLKIEENDKYGHHVVATHDLTAGQTILIEQPYSIAHTSSELKRRDRCMQCFKECTNFIPCPNCVSALYCNEECMERSYHKYHCILWVPEPDKDKFRLVLETFFKINDAFPDVDIFMNTVELLLNGKQVSNLTSDKQKEFGLIFKLITNHEKKSTEQAERLRVIAHHCYFAVALSSPNLKEKFKQPKHRRFLQHFMLHLCHICEHAYNMDEFFMGNDDENAVDYERNHYANGMFSFGNFINHSCVPNVFRYMVDDKLVWKVIRPVEKGQQLFRSYVLQPILIQDSPVKSRKVMLEHHFKCECVMCSGKAQMEPEINFTENPALKRGLKPAFMMVGEFKQLSLETVEHYEAKAIEFLQQFDRYHPNSASILLQRIWFVIWNFLVTRFEGAPLRLEILQYRK